MIDALYILGAGFSHNAGLPLQRDFTDALLEAGNFSRPGPSRTLTWYLSAFVAEVFGHIAKTPSWPELEDIFTCINLAANTGHHLGPYSPADLRTVRRALISRTIRMLGNHYTEDRHPHHTTSAVALVGGGSIPRPGEITLAHRGVLFLDEFAEFSRSLLESLRQPLEDSVITVSRAAGTFTFPAKFTLVAAQNPCPCGYLGDPVKRCSCPQSQIIKYQKKISGPLLDRIDLHVDVPRLSYEKMQAAGVSPTSAEIKRRVEAARALQQERFNSPRTNSEMTPQEIKKFCALGQPEQQLLRQVMARYNFSGRSLHRILKVSRTIADLAGEERISVAHLAEAAQYRPKTE